MTDEPAVRRTTHSSLGGRLRVAPVGRVIKRADDTPIKGPTASVVAFMKSVGKFNFVVLYFTERQRRCTISV